MNKNTLRSKIIYATIIGGLSGANISVSYIENDSDFNSSIKIEAKLASSAQASSDDSSDNNPTKDKPSNNSSTPAFLRVIKTFRINPNIITDFRPNNITLKDSNPIDYNGCKYKNIVLTSNNYGYSTQKISEERTALILYAHAFKTTIIVHANNFDCSEHTIYSEKVGLLVN